MKAKELVAMQKEQLISKLSELQLELMKMNTQVHSGTTPKSPGQLRSVKKEIARIKTVLHQKEARKNA